MSDSGGKDWVAVVCTVLLVGWCLYCVLMFGAEMIGGCYGRLTGAGSPY